MRTLQHRTPSIRALTLCLLALIPLTRSLSGEDWPEWRGPGRLGVWNNDHALLSFPSEGLPVRWEVEVYGGYSGPAVAGGRVFVTDFAEDPEHPKRGQERVLCLREATGKVLWSRSWTVSYARLMSSYAIGPRATPTVDGDTVYVVGATGTLKALDVATGDTIWGKDYAEDYGTQVPTWGITGSPLVEGDLLIAIVGGQPDAEVVAFEKLSGKEVWRALSSQPEMGYAQPVVLEAGGKRQLIVWHPTGVTSLNPHTGEVYWYERWPAPMGLTVATPVWQGQHLFFSQFYGGSLMMELDQDAPGAHRLWARKGRSERPEDTEALQALITTPVLQDNLIVGIGSYGQLRGLNLNGDRLWESLRLVELRRWGTAFIVRNGDRYFASNDLGDLVIARFDSSGYHEIDRTHLIEPTTDSTIGRGGREKVLVNWSHPAYANGHIVARNDRVILSRPLTRPRD